MKKTRLLLIALFSIFAVLLLTKHTFAQDTYRSSLLKGIKAKVGALAFSPDGTLLASGNHGKIRLWDVTSQRERLTFSRDTNKVIALAFLMDGKTVASVDKDGTLRLWDTATGDLRTTFMRLMENPTVLGFSPNGTTLAAADWTGNLYLWDTATGRKIFSRLTEHIGTVSALAFTPDSRTVISGGRDGACRTWDVATGVLQLGNQVGQASAEWVLVVSADGSTFAGGIPADPEVGIQVWHAKSGDQIASITPKHAGSDWVLAISPDGTRLANGGRDGKVFVVDTATGKDIMRFTEHTDGINTLMFSPDGNRLASSSRDGEILVWDIGSGEILLALADYCGYLAFSPDGKTLASVGRGINLWILETGDRITLTTYEGIGVKALIFSPDSKTLVTGGRSLRSWDVATGALTVDLDPYLDESDLRLIQSLVFSPDGKTLAIGDWENVILWDWERIAFWGTPFDR
jgi:WD40 repeat protein